jgi:antitoxin (DNA-binding transcriptional repressor) of toxin-antitoxin stability system
MIATATELATDSKNILDKVIRNGETVEIQRHGKTVAIIRPKEGVTMSELLELLNGLDWSEEERGEVRGHGARGG